MRSTSSYRREIARHAATVSWGSMDGAVARCARFVRSTRYIVRRDSAGNAASRRVGSLVYFKRGGRGEKDRQVVREKGLKILAKDTVLRYICIYM